MVAYQKALRVARDQEFRQHSRDSLRSASRAACRARRVQKEKSRGRGLVIVAGSLVLASLAAWILRSLRSN